MCSKSPEHSVGDLKDKIETALNNVEEIKNKHAEVSFRTQEYEEKEEYGNEKEDDIVLYVSIKIKKDKYDKEDVVSVTHTEERNKEDDKNEIEADKSQISTVERKEKEYEVVNDFKTLETDDVRQIDSTETRTECNEKIDQCPPSDVIPTTEMNDCSIEETEIDASNADRKESTDVEEPKGVHWFRDEWKEKEPEEKEFESIESPGGQLCEAGDTVGPVISVTKHEESVKVELIEDSIVKDKESKETSKLKEKTNTNLNILAQDEKEAKCETNNKSKIKKIELKNKEKIETIRKKPVKQHSRDIVTKEKKNKDENKSEKTKGAHGLKLILTKENKKHDKLPESNDKQDKPVHKVENIVEVSGKSIGPSKKKKLPRKSKTAPSTPLKSPTATSAGQVATDEHKEDKLTACNSMETLPTEFGTPMFSRIRRLRSRHSQSLDRVWLPGRRESFNSRVSKRFVKNENVGGPTSRQYYFAGQSVQNQCMHGHGKI